MKFGHFEFDPEKDRLGEGPQSEVFRAVDARLGRTVALKILRPHVEVDPAAAQRFEREAKHTSSLEHPNIATIFEYGQQGKTSYIAMEHLEGRTLDRVIAKGPVSFEEGVRIGIQVCSALETVHAQGLVHRDLKPANIMVLQDGTVKLLDFGICRSTDESNITQSGMLVGTVLYMAPEQVRGDEVTPPTDIFALGSVLYHAMTGSLPFPGRSFPEVCMAILDGKPLRPSEQRGGFPELLETFLMRCLQSDPENRYPDGAAAAAGLAGVAEQMRLSMRAQNAANLRGHILIPPLEIASADEHARLLGGGVRKDLCAELQRSTQLQVVLLDEPPEVGGRLPGEGGSFLMNGMLSVEGTVGTLDYSVERAPGAELIDTTELWADRIRVEDEDEWGLQAQLVTSLVRSLRRRLSSFVAQPSGEIDRDPDAAVAHCYYAHDVLHRGTTKHLMAAISSFRRALEADPGCALAYAGLAESLVRKFLYWDGDASFLEQSKEMARRALSVDPGCAEAHTSLGFANFMDGRHQDAKREYRLAIQTDNDEWLAHRLLGALLARTGNHKGASPLLRRAIALRPTQIGSYDHLYNVLLKLDRYEEALEIADRGIQAARRHLTQVPDDQDARLHLALLLARLGSRDEARAQAEDARARAPKDGFTAFHVACVYCQLQDTDRGIQYLQEAQSRGYYIQSELIGNSDLDGLRGEPGFQRLVS